MTVGMKDPEAVTLRSHLETLAWAEKGQVEGPLPLCCSRREVGQRSGRFSPQRWPPQEKSWMWLLWSVFQQQREPATAALPEVTATETPRTNTGRAAELCK